MDHSQMNSDAPQSVNLDDKDGNAVRAFVVAQCKAPGRSLAWLSKECGKNHAYFQQFVRRGTPVQLPEDVRQQAARALGLADVTIALTDDPRRAAREPPIRKIKSRQSTGEPYLISMTQGRLRGEFDLANRDECDELIEALRSWRRTPPFDEIGILR
jgi:hypothetical protein